MKRILDYRTLASLRGSHPGWRLLVAATAPLVISFLQRAFIQTNVRTLSHGNLVSLLDDHLFQLRVEFGEDAFPRPAREYLDDWADDSRGWLRKYYPPNNDEPHYDITPAAEGVIEWLASLQTRPFVATESRLLTVFELLRQIIQGSELNADARIARLEQRRQEIEAEIREVQQGRFAPMDAAAIKDRFVQMAATARGLLSDFREVEQNFRLLDRSVREQIARWEDGKGALLHKIFADRDLIADSDQGKSFRAFWDFLMSPARQEELSELLEAVFALEPVRSLEPDRRLLRIHFDWLTAGEAAQRTVARLSEQLRRYLDDQAWLENRRIMQIIRNIEQSALSMRSAMPEGPFMTIDDPAPAIGLPMARVLFSPPLKARLDGQELHGDVPDISADALFDQAYVDRARLAAAIRRALQTRPQISLADLVAAEPLEQGLSEIVAYLALAAEDQTALIDDSLKQQLYWRDSDGVRRVATVPLVIFQRGAVPASRSLPQ